MTYSLGIDLGTTTCTVARRDGPTIEICPLGPGAAGLPSVALAGRDGQVLVGHEADRRCRHEPPLVARYVQGRLDGPAPIEVDGHRVDPALLTAALLRAAAERAAPAPGATADQTVVTFPLGPGSAPEAVVTSAAIDALGPDTVLVPAPVAALAQAATTHDLGDDAVVAVVDVGGTTVDVALLRRTPDAFDLVGEPATLPDLGGLDLDAAVLALVESSVGDVTSTVDPGDRAGMLALRRLRAACRAAKERLSTEHDATVEVALPHARGHVEVTRDAYERTIEPALVEIADLVAHTVDANGLTLPDLEAIVLVGGAARTPRVTEVLAERLGRPVLRDDAPEATVALGGALFAEVADAAVGPAAIPPAPVLASMAQLGDAPAPEPPPDLGIDGNGALPGLAALADIPPVGPTTGGGPLPWQSAAPADDDLPFRDTGDMPALPADPTPGAWDTAAPSSPEPWESAVAPTAARADGWAPPPPPALDDGGWGAPGAADAGAPDATALALPQDAWGQTSDAQVRRLTTSDTDPFGQRSSGVLASLRRERQAAEDAEVEADRAGTVDRRLVVGGVAAAIIVLMAGCWLAFASLGGGSSARITVADANRVRSATSSTIDLATASTTGASTTTTSTTEAPTTTAEPPSTAPPPTEPAPVPLPPPTTAPPSTTPPSTTPPTTRPPQTTTTSSTTTSSTSTTTTTEQPTGPGNGNGNG
jgi:molecular chaperone DnaK